MENIRKLIFHAIRKAIRKPTPLRINTLQWAGIGGSTNPSLNQINLHSN